MGGRRRFLRGALAAALLPLLARLGVRRPAPGPAAAARSITGRVARHWKRIA